MSNFFLHTEACNIKSCDSFITGLSELNTTFVDRERDDNMMKHDSIWNLPIMRELFAKYNQETGVLCGFIEQLSSQETDINALELFDSLFPDQLNAFLGIDFTSTSISVEKRICKKEDYLEVKNDYLWKNVSPTTLWSDKAELFPSLLFCDCVETQCSKLGKSPEFNKILSRLFELNRASSDWNTGAFEEHVKKYGLTISPESRQTMTYNKGAYKKERDFRLPSGETKTFDLHIKLTGLRIHIYPDYQTHTIYVGYIGTHLPTVKHN